MYESHFGLLRRPFAATPSQQWYFPAAAIESARLALGRCIERAEGIGSVVGASGTGKSLLLGVLAAEFADRFQVVTIANSHLATRRALLQTILFELGLRFRRRDEGELRLELIERLTRSEPAAPNLLLLIDEAHALPSRLLEEVRMITNLVRRGQPCVRLVLAGSQRLEERLTSPRLDSFNQRMAVRCYLEPLGRSETAQYVRHYIDAAGGDPDSVLAPEALEAIYRATEGVPRLVNQLSDHALLLAYADGARRLDAATVAQAWTDLQQLPAPWGTQPAEELPATTTAVEFGSLDEDQPATPDSPATIAVSIDSTGGEDAAHADEPLEWPLVDRLLPEVSASDSPTDELPIWFEQAAPEPAGAADAAPVAEEVVRDHYAALDAAREARVPAAEPPPLPVAASGEPLPAEARLLDPRDRTADETLSLAEALVQYEIGRAEAASPVSPAAVDEAGGSDGGWTLEDRPAFQSPGEPTGETWDPEDDPAEGETYDRAADGPSPVIAQPNDQATLADTPSWERELPAAPALDWEDATATAPWSTTPGAEAEVVAFASEPAPAGDEDLIVVESAADEAATAARPVHRHEYRQLFRRLRGSQR